MKNKIIPSIQLGDKLISSKSKPYIIAEIGVNHEGSLDLAKELIFLSKEGGADAAKFQTYKADTIASKNSPAYWDTQKEKTLSQHELFKKYDSFEEEDYFELSKYCKSIGIDFVSTPFDHKAVDMLDPLMPYFKISSSDITNFPLLRKIATKDKPIILSTGASNLIEIENAVKELLENGSKEIALMHCILNYPTKNENANLNMILDLQEKFPDYPIGYSDHTTPDKHMMIITNAILKGASIIEKHFTNDKSLPGNDHYHAMDIHDLKVLHNNLEIINLTNGFKDKKALPSEEISRANARRSIVLKKDLEKGHILTENDLICKRPGTGISPEKWDEVIGKKINKNLLEDHILEWEDFDKNILN